MTEEEAKAEEDKMFERLRPLALLSLETLIEAAAALKIKDKFGTEEAKALIKKHGGTKLQDLYGAPLNMEAFIAEAEKMLNPPPAKND